MWRSRSFEEWERKKSYLIRSLFEDIPILSPILEGGEPASLSIPSSLNSLIDRIESPLPELIIEVEPKKPNLHDEPAELYDELAKVIRRMYRKDFLGIESSNTSTSENLNRGRIYDNTMSCESDNENALDERDRCQIDCDAPELQKDNDLDIPTHADTGASKESSIHVASKSVIIQDVLSQEYETQENLTYTQGFTESKQYRQCGVDSVNVSKTTNVLESIAGGDDDIDKEERSDSESFAKDTNASSIDSVVNRPSSRASPEIMRQRQPLVSLGTPPHRPDSESNSTVNKTIHLSMEVDSNKFSEDVLPSDQEIEIAEGSGNESLSFVTSTPKRKKTTSRFSTNKGNKRRLVSYSSSSISASAANVALQTSFSDCNTDWCCFWSNYFKGMPKVYNLCSCNDHVCTT